MERRGHTARHYIEQERGRGFRRSMVREDLERTGGRYCPGVIIGNKWGVWESSQVQCVGAMVRRISVRRGESGAVLYGTRVGRSAQHRQTTVRSVCQCFH